MTLQEFIDLIAEDGKDLTQKEIEVYYDMSIKIFNVNFDKWKKKKLSSIKQNS